MAAQDYPSLGQLRTTSAFMVGPYDIEPGLRGPRLRAPWLKRILVAMAVMGVGTLVLWGGNAALDAADGIPGFFRAVIWIAGLGFLLIGASVLAYSRDVQFDSASRTIRMTKRFGPMASTREIPVDTVTARTAVTTGARDCCVELHPREGGSKILLCQGPQAKMDEVMAMMAQSLGLEGADDTRIHMKVADGQILTASRLALGTGSSMHPDARLAIEGDTRARVVPGQRERVFWWLLAAIPLAVMFLFVLAAIGAGEAMLGVIPGLLCLPLAVVGVWGLTGLGAVRAVFDKSTGRLAVTGAARREGDVPKVIPLSSILAVQTIRRWVHRTSSRQTRAEQSYWGWQLILVLRDPPGARIRLMSHGGEGALRHDAHQLAAFLDVPLLEPDGA